MFAARTGSRAFISVAFRSISRNCSILPTKVSVSSPRSFSTSIRRTESERQFERRANDPNLDKIWNRIYTAEGDVEKLNAAYKNWAQQYDEDLLQKAGCDNQLKTALELKEVLSAGRVLDIGCGTGIVGERIKELGMKQIQLDGFDPSPEMLEASKKKLGLYDKLWVGELGPPLDGIPTNAYDAAVCVGVFTHGHCGPESFHECIRVVSPGGFFIFTVREDLYNDPSTGFLAEMKRLEEYGSWKMRKISQPMQLLPKLEPSALYRLFTAEILPGKRPEPSEQFAEAVIKLANTPAGPNRTIDHRFEYDCPGSILFERYCNEFTLSEDGSIRGYYLTHCEMDALSFKPLFELGSGDGCISEIVELGPSSGRKINLILKSCGQHENPARNLMYRPIDISQNALTMTQNDVNAEFSNVDVRPAKGDFFECLEDLAKESAGLSHSRAIIMLGSTIGNYETPEEMVAFLQQLKKVLNAKDRLFIGTDLHKDEKALLSAYNSGDANTRWWVNVVRRINNEFGAQPPFKTSNDSWTTASVYNLASDPNTQPSYMDYNIKSLEAQSATLTYPPSVAGTKISFEAGEVIRIGRGCKFTDTFMAHVCNLAGLKLVQSHTDKLGYFAIQEMQVA